MVTLSSFLFSIRFLMVYEGALVFRNALFGSEKHLWNYENFVYRSASYFLVFKCFVSDSAS